LTLPEFLPAFGTFADPKSGHRKTRHKEKVSILKKSSQLNCIQGTTIRTRVYGKSFVPGDFSASVEK